MLHYFFLCNLLVLTNLILGQNLKDDQNKRIGHWIYYGKDRPNSNYPENSKIEEGEYINGFKEGIWIKYYPDGKTKMLEGNYVNNRPYGMYTYYYNNGVIKEKGNFSFRNFNGPFFRYYRNGNLAYKCTFNKEGKETGLIQHFHPNGQLALEFTSKDGEAIGELTRYYENGSIREKLVLDSNGKISKILKFDIQPIIIHDNNESKDEHLLPPKVIEPNTHGIPFAAFGTNMLYNDNDAIWIEGLFKNGQLWDGNVYEYDQDGIIKKIRVFKNGKYHSDGQL